MNDIQTNKGEIVMYQPDETIRLEVRVEDETVWLNRQQIADLFSRDIKTVGKHITKGTVPSVTSNTSFCHAKLGSWDFGFLGIWYF